MNTKTQAFLNELVALCLKHRVDILSTDERHGPEFYFGGKGISKFNLDVAQMQLIREQAERDTIPKARKEPHRRN